MNRGDVYRIAKPPGNDPKKYRYFVIVSRDMLINSKFSTVPRLELVLQKDSNMRVVYIVML